MCSVNWPLVVSLLAALGSCGAAIAAVWIATRDRRERRAERLNAAKAQAMLVLVDVHASRGAAAFEVWVHNFATLAILDVEIASATYKPEPTATFQMQGRPKLIAAKPDGQRDRLIVEFVDSKGFSVVPGGCDEDGNFRTLAKDEDVDATVRFMDAHGHHWLRSMDAVTLLRRGHAL